MKPRMSTLTEAEEADLRYTAKQGWAAESWHVRDALREIDFLRGLINDLTQDGITEVYNKGYAQCLKDVRETSVITIDAPALTVADLVIDATSTGCTLSVIDTEVQRILE